MTMLSKEQFKREALWNLEQRRHEAHENVDRLFDEQKASIIENLDVWHARVAEEIEARMSTAAAALH